MRTVISVLLNSIVALPLCVSRGRGLEAIGKVDLCFLTAKSDVSSNSATSEEFLDELDDCVVPDGNSKTDSVVEVGVSCSWCCHIGLVEANSHFPLSGVAGKAGLGFCFKFP
jgi:hypothetical protein